MKADMRIARVSKYSWQAGLWVGNWVIAHTHLEIGYIVPVRKAQQRKNVFYISKSVWRWSARLLFLSNFAIARYFEHGDCAIFFCISLEIKVLCQVNGLLKATIFVPKWRQKNRHFIVFSVTRLGEKAEKIHSLYWAGQSVHCARQRCLVTQVGNSCLNIILDSVIKSLLRPKNMYNSV